MKGLAVSALNHRALLTRWMSASFLLHRNDALDVDLISGTLIVFVRSQIFLFMSFSVPLCNSSSLFLTHSLFDLFFMWLCSISCEHCVNCVGQWKLMLGLAPPRGVRKDYIHLCQCTHIAGMEPACVIS